MGFIVMGFMFAGGAFAFLVALRIAWAALCALGDLLSQ
jgi:hypothetical protein